MGMAHNPVPDADRMRTIAYLTGGTDNPAASYLIFKVAQALSVPPWHLEDLIGQLDDPNAQRWYGWALDFLHIEADAQRILLEKAQQQNEHQHKTGRDNGTMT